MQRRLFSAHTFRIACLLSQVFLEFCFLSERADAKIKIGTTLPLTGKYATNGKAMAQGYRFMVTAFLKAYQDKNTSTAPLEIDLIIRDNQSIPSRGARLAESLITDDKVEALLGPFSSGVIDAMAPLAAKFKIPLILSTVSSSHVAQSENPYLFSISTPQEKLFTPLLNHFKTQTESPKIALAFMEDPYSLFLYQSVTKYLDLSQAHIVFKEIIESNFVDLSDILVSAKAKQAQLLLFSAHARGATTLIKTASDLKLKLPQIAMTHCQSGQIQTIAPLYSDKVICPTQWHPELTYKDALFGNTQGFVKAYKAAYHLSPSVPVAQSAAAALTLLSALAASNAPKKLRNILEKTKINSFFGPIGFDKKGQNRQKPSVLLQIQQGAYKPIFPTSAVPYTYQP